MNTVELRINRGDCQDMLIEADMSADPGMPRGTILSDCCPLHKKGDKIELTNNEFINASDLLFDSLREPVNNP